MPITTRKSVNRKINMTENTTASSAADLPEFPGHPESHNMMWTILEIAAIKKYGADMFRAGRLAASAPVAPAPLSEMPYEKRKAIQEGEQISASDAWFHARHEMLDTIDRRNVFRAGFDRGWNAALAAQGGKA